MKLLIGSLQYSPIFKSGCVALGRQCEMAGHDVKYMFSSGYHWMLDENTRTKTTLIGRSSSWSSAFIDGLNASNRVRIRKLITEWRPDYVYLDNVHPFLNRYVAATTKKIGSSFIQHIHEPYTEDKSAYELSHRIILHLFEILQRRLLDDTDVAVVSSLGARDTLKKRYPHFGGKIVLVPLIYEDNGKCSETKAMKEYITFVGPPVASKWPERLLELVEYTEKNSLEYMFLLISRKKISDSRFFGHSRLRVFSQEFISDEEIGGLMSQSIMTLAPYKTARQSAVVVTSYMYGVPLLATNIPGLKEDIEHLKTGYLVDTDAPMNEWIAGIEFIRSNNQALSATCRSRFVSRFSEDNWPQYFGSLFDGERIETDT